MKYLWILFAFVICVCAQNDETIPPGEDITADISEIHLETEVEDIPADIQQSGMEFSGGSNISPFFRIGAGIGLQIHQGGSWRNGVSGTFWRGGEWEGFNAGVSNISMGVLVRSVDCTFTLDNTTAWFNTQSCWGDDPLAASSVTAVMGTWFPSEDWSVGGGFGMFLLGTPFNNYGTLSGPAGMATVGRRVSEDVFVEGRFFAGVIKQDHSQISDAGLVIGVNVVVNNDLIF